MATPKPSEERPMWIRTIVGVLLILVGGVWFAQGINVLGGSSMTGNSTWAVIGFPMVVVGVVLLRSRRRDVTS